MQHRPPMGSGSVSNLDSKSCDHSLSFICSSPTSEENKIISFVRLFLPRLPKLNIAVGTCNIIRSHRVVNLNLAQQWRLPRSVTKTKALIWTLHILVWEQYRVGKQHYFLQKGRGLDVCKYFSGDKWISCRTKPHSNNTQRWRKLENRGEIQSYS